MTNRKIAEKFIATGVGLFMAGSALSLNDMYMAKPSTEELSPRAQTYMALHNRDPSVRGHLLNNLDAIVTDVEHVRTVDGPMPEIAYIMVEREINDYVEQMNNFEQRGVMLGAAGKLAANVGLGVFGIGLGLMSSRRREYDNDR